MYARECTEGGVIKAKNCFACTHTANSHNFTCEQYELKKFPGMKT